MKRYICDGIVKGATHVRNQMPCQDNRRIVEISDNIIIVAVADGHGSSKCPRSDRGSMIAVNSFCEVMKSYLKVYGEDEAGLSNLITFLNREGDMRFAQDICEEWQARVKQSFYKNKVDGMTDEDGNIKWTSVFSMYGTTLLGMLVTESFVFSFQIGDGDISVVTKDEVAPLVEPERFLGTETHSLSKLDAWRKAVASVRRREIESKESYMYILSTDGFANSYTSDKEYQKTCNDYLQMIQEHGAETVQANLKNWLTETSELGCGDDITVVMVFFFQIGDGDISVVTKDEVAPLVEPERFLGTETHSLSKLDAWRKAVASVRRREIESKESYMYILSTDGFANSYTSDKEYQKTCNDYLQMIQEHGAETVQANLKNWLTETSELGCGDDITVVMVFFAKE